MEFVRMILQHFYQDIEGWFNDQNRELYDLALKTYNEKEVSFVEVGSWKGKSASYMATCVANSQNKINFYAVDTWKGSLDESAHVDDIDIINDTLFETFLKNIEPVKDYVVPIRKPSIEAAKDFEDESLDFIFLDASHTFKDVTDDLNSWYPKCKKGGLIGGDDYWWGEEKEKDGGVTRAVNEFIEQCENQELYIDSYRVGWWHWKK
jgi:predicted O-methyltransferase YrrM